MRLKQALLFLVTSAFLLLPTQMLQAKSLGGDDENPFTISFDEGPLVVKPGESVIFPVHFEVPPDHYLYSDKLDIQIEESSQVSVGSLTKSPSVSKLDPFLGETVQVHFDQADLFLELKMPKNFAQDQKISGQILLQGCSHELCFRPLKIPFKLIYKSSVAQTSMVQSKVTVPKADFLVEGSVWQKLKKQISNPDIDGLLGQKNYALSLTLAFIGGILSDLTPCVWPMIPVTMVIIGVRRDKSRARNFLAVLVMVLGMAVMYSLLGVVSALFGKSLGFLFQQTFFLWLLFSVLVIMGLSMLGLFEFKLPPRFLTWLSKHTATGYRGVFLVGFTLGVLAAPCVGPVIGSILVYVAKSQDVLLGFWLMLFYALGMGSVFVLMGLLYQSFQLKTKSNAFTVFFKKALGIALLVVAAYYGLIAYNQAKGDHLVDSFWSESANAGFERAIQENKPVVIDFYADWCLPCRELEEKVWSKPSVQDFIKANYVAIHVDCTQESAECKANVDRFKVIGWPTIVFLDSKQNETKRLVGQIVDQDTMIKLLQENLDL